MTPCPLCAAGVPFRTYGMPLRVFSYSHFMPWGVEWRCRDESMLFLLDQDYPTL